MCLNGGAMSDKTETRTILSKVAEQFDGAVPNVYRTLARHPAALDAFVQVENILEHRGNLSPAEQALVALEVAVTNGCQYCQGVFAHEARNSSVAPHCVERMLKGALPLDARFRVLVEATRRVLETRGHLGRAEMLLFRDRGVSLEDLLEITTIISAYTLATYANNLANTRVDPEFR